MSENSFNPKRRRFLGSMLITGCYLGLAPTRSRAGKNISNTQADPGKYPAGTQDDGVVRDAIKKAENFDYDYQDDIYLNAAQFALLKSSLHRLSRIQGVIGYANFNLVSFDAARNYANRYSAIGAFSKTETAFIESLYSVDAAAYGFLGKKVSAELTDSIQQRDVFKVRGTGHYLYRGAALNTYLGMQKRLGQHMELTSGVRSVVKQLMLFMSKAQKSGGNLSRAARSLAPPGHSFHGVGDFDVGQRGLGAANFTNAFAQTRIYQQLCDLGLNSMRYPFANPYGVRHEPWHIKVVKDV